MALSPKELRDAVKDLAFAEVQKVMVEAEESGRHTPGSWINEGMDWHLQHCNNHAINALNRSFDNGLNIPLTHSEWRAELTHNLCRAAMALYSFDAALIESQGDEGRGQFIDTGFILDPNEGKGS